MLFVQKLHPLIVMVVNYKLVHNNAEYGGILQNHVSAWIIVINTYQK